MTLPFTRLVGALLGLILVLGPGLVHAAVVPTAEGTLRFVCSDADGSKHPKRALIEQVVPRQPPTRAEGTAFVLDYDSSQEGETKAGVVRATIELSRDGDTRKLLSFKIKTDPRDGHAAHVGAVSEVLEVGDLLRWKLKFKKFDPLRRDKCFVLLATTSALRTEGDPEALGEDEP